MSWWTRRLPQERRFALSSTAGMKRRQPHPYKDATVVKMKCELCGNEMAGSDFGRVRREVGDLTIEVLVGFKKVWNAGKICNKCVIDAVNSEPTTRSSAIA